ncbi:tetratricopeptide repeat protein [Nibricoccus sp. IMCC34717]|uniref:tetratricopeptide repeat protein n=1 Tax=Nibricoccus sp. IMCC34717 TaxID=3034021 RepID=UPI003850AE38
MTRRLLTLALVSCFAIARAPIRAEEPAPSEHETSEAPSPAESPDSTTAEAPAPPASGETTQAEATHAEAAHADAHSEAHNTATANPAKDEEIASLLRIGQKKLDAKDFESAEIAYRQLLHSGIPREIQREAAVGLARTYRRKGELTKATAVYEKVIKEFPDDAVLPAVYLELGRSQRALGAYKQAITRFYSVINATLKLSDSGADNYRQLARTAQFEIAETYFQSGDYEQANRFFSRLKLLDLAPEDRARAHFKSAYALILGGNHEKATQSLRGFLEQYPDAEENPEARYLLSTSLQTLGRGNESLNTALELLRVERKRSDKDAKRWLYWQRKTGNTLANAFYERGDIASALVIYENLAKISEEPQWRLPVAYQIGLCHERLQMYDRARESYQTIIDIVKSPGTDVGKRTEIADLAEMAAWRLNQLSWYQDTQRKVAQLFPSQRSEVRPPTSNPAHDANGSAPKPPEPLR